MNPTTFCSLGPINARIICAENLAVLLHRFPASNEGLSRVVEVNIEESRETLEHKYNTRRTADGFAIQTPFYRGFYGHAEGKAHILLAPVDAVLETQDRRLYGALRCILSLYLMEEGGAAFHGCAIVNTSGAHIFLGKSGAGKTTLAKTAEPESVLGDDLVAILPNQVGGFEVFGTPFTGREGMNSSLDSAPLKTASVLEKGHHTRQESLSSNEAIQALLEHCFVFDESLHTRNTVLDTACRVGASATFFRSYISLSAPVWELEGLR